MNEGAGSLLFLGGSHPQKLAVRSLREWGFDAHVTDRTARPPCADETPHVHRIDATDVNAVVALAEQLQGKGGFVGAYGIADYAMPAVAAVNRFLAGRAAPAEAIDIMIDKDATKAALEAAGVPLPCTLWRGRAREFSTADVVSLDCDVIVKPADVHASRGIARVAAGEVAALELAVADAGAVASTVLVEEYLDGDIWNVDALAVDGTVHPVSVTRRVAHETLAFLPSLQVQDCRADERHFEELAALAADVAHGLGYLDGPFTVDLIMSSNGPRVLEVSPHFHSIALELLRGNANPIRAWFRCLAGDPRWKEDLEPAGELAGALAMLRAEQVGQLKGIEGETALSGDPLCAEYVRLKPDGTEIRSVTAQGGLLALAWWRAPSLTEIVAELGARIAGFRPRIEA
jgi:formate-dependent phosphoribosylglycinamide formyltransferase (GAR transformylase)